MGTRPYYIIYHTVDYDGYEVYIDYVGSNFKAAADRYNSLFQSMRQRNFLDDGVEEDNINGSYTDPIEIKDRPGTCAYSYLNDNDTYYLNITMMCTLTGKFTPAPNGAENIYETDYRNRYPNSKY